MEWSGNGEALGIESGPCWKGIDKGEFMAVDKNGTGELRGADSPFSVAVAERPGRPCDPPGNWEVRAHPNLRTYRVEY